MPRVLGITGKIACGKTSVGQMLLALGVERYLDADALVHRLYEPGQPLTAQIAELFGPQMLASDGSVERRALGALVFQNSEALQRLEQIVHPAVSHAISQELAQTRADGIVVIDAVKLLEGASGKLCEARWLITCSEEQQLQRLMARNHFTLNEARHRLAAQPDFTRFASLIDEVIDNSGSIDQTTRQVAEAFARFCQKDLPG